MTDTSCSVFEPIVYSKSKDTKETVDQVVEHNAAWDRLCPAPPAKKATS